MRITQLIMHSYLSKMKNKILPICLQGNYTDSLGEFSNTSYGVFGLRWLTKVTGQFEWCFWLMEHISVIS